MIPSGNRWFAQRTKPPWLVRGFPIDFHTFQMVIAWYCILVYIMAICIYIIIYIEWSPHHFPLSHGFPLIFLCLPRISHIFPSLSRSFIRCRHRWWVRPWWLPGWEAEWFHQRSDFARKKWRLHGQTWGVNHSEAYPLVMSTVCYWKWPSQNSWFTQLEHGDFP